MQIGTIALACLPAVAALHHYAVNYGYRGMSKQEALARSKTVFYAVAGICAALFAIKAVCDLIVAGTVRF